jgi:NADPH-dependent ferric siderophore reductase
MAQFEAGQILASRSLAPEIVNVTIAADSLRGVEFQPGADVSLRFDDGHAAVHERRYSVWRSSAEGGTLDICVVRHELGPGSRWAARCAAGDAVKVARSPALPIALDRSADAHILLGDETSIAAAEALIAALPAGATVLACFEVGSARRQWPKSELARPDVVDWIERAGRPGAALLDQFARRHLSTTATATAYVTGEAWLCAMLRAHLIRERGFRPDAIRAMPYWKARVGAT